MRLNKLYLTKNDCYTVSTKIRPVGIVVHSTGANNPNLKRYIAPDDGVIGKNIFNNSWNKKGIKKCVHAFIGKDKNKEVKIYQTLPFNIAAWGVGSGKKGSYNYNPTAHIQFEICEDNLKDEKYLNEAFNQAIEFCTYLCKTYKLDPSTIVSHNEAYKLGYASNHKDCNHWLKKYNKDMDWFRSEVKNKLSKETSESKKEYVTKKVFNCTCLNVRTKPSMQGKIIKTIKKGTKVTIYKTQGNWSKISLKSNEWVYSSYLK